MLALWTSTRITEKQDKVHTRRDEKEKKHTVCAECKCYFTWIRKKRAFLGRNIHIITERNTSHIRLLLTKSNLCVEFRLQASIFFVASLFNVSVIVTSKFATRTKRTCVRSGIFVFAILTKFQSRLLIIFALHPMSKMC